jgi:hypothetical protein
MMKRFFMLMALALMLGAAMALSGVAQAAPISDKADAQCAKLAIRTLGPSANPSNYTFHGGTEDTDSFSLEGTADVPDVFCGFGSFDLIATLDEGDIFLGGAGNDFVGSNHGTFYGEEGDDHVRVNFGTFYGGAGDDSVDSNAGGGIFVQ